MEMKKMTNLQNTAVKLGYSLGAVNIIYFKLEQ